MGILSRWREKYANVSPEIREVFDPSNGDLIQTIQADGSEVLDDTPIAPPVGYNRQVPLHLQIREMVRSEALRLAAEESGMETFEESEDFDIDDDEYDPQSQWENEFDPSYGEIHSAVEEDRKTRQEAVSRASKKSSSGDQPDSVTEPAQPASSAEQLQP